MKENDENNIYGELYEMLTPDAKSRPRPTFGAALRTPSTVVRLPVAALYGSRPLFRLPRQPR